MYIIKNRKIELKKLNK